jgi:G:T-mismatch repair DNA endonuclease (very short patch repair protein)
VTSLTSREHITWPKANGEWWRGKIESTVARDRRNDAVLAAGGWAVVRVWEHEPVWQAADRVVRRAARFEREQTPLLPKDHTGLSGWVGR